MSGLLDNFWVLLGLKVLVAALVIPGVSLVIIFAELKISAHMQSRVGPYFAGGRWGWAQPLADGLKFMQKEDLVPADADRPVFKIAPMLVLAGSVLVLTDHARRKTRLSAASRSMCGVTPCSPP